MTEATIGIETNMPEAENIELSPADRLINLRFLLTPDENGQLVLENSGLRLPTHSFNPDSILTRTDEPSPEQIRLSALLGIETLSPDWHATISELTAYSAQLQRARAIDEPATAEFFRLSHENMEQCKKDGDEDAWRKREEDISNRPQTEDEIWAGKVTWKHTLRMMDSHISANVEKFFNRPEIYSAWGSQVVLHSFWPNYQYQEVVSPGLADAVALELLIGIGPEDNIPEPYTTDPSDTWCEPLGEYGFYSQNIAEAFVLYTRDFLETEVGQNPRVREAYVTVLNRIKTGFPDLRDLVNKQTGRILGDKYTAAEVPDDLEGVMQELNDGSSVVFVTTRVDNGDGDPIEFLHKGFMVTECGQYVPFDTVLKWLGHNPEEYNWFDMMEYYRAKKLSETGNRFWIDESSLGAVLKPLFKEQWSGITVIGDADQDPGEVLVNVQAIRIRATAGYPITESDYYRLRTGHEDIREMNRRKAQAKIFPYGHETPLEIRNRIRGSIGMLQITNPDNWFGGLDTTDTEVILPDTAQEAANALFEKGFVMQIRKDDGNPTVAARISNRFVRLEEYSQPDYVTPIEFDSSTDQIVAAQNILPLLGIQNRPDAISILNQLAALSRKDGLAFTYKTKEEWAQIQGEVQDFFSHKSIYEAWTKKQI